jgi:alpha-tubulin suppressor-like RCC1 family protein
VKFLKATFLLAAVQLGLSSPVFCQTATESPWYDAAMLKLRGFAAYGTSDTNIPRFTTVATNFGSAWTFTTNATEGSKITILQDGIYSLAINFASTNSVNSDFCGFSLNASAADRDTPIQNLAPPGRIGISSDQSTSSGILSQPSFSTVIRLSSNDVVRPHTSGHTPGNAGLAEMILTRAFFAEDTDDDGLPDKWEIQFFGNLSQTANVDYDEDGYTNYQEFINNTDPQDFYNGVLPTLSIFSGNLQTGITNIQLADPLVISVTTNSIKLTNAPITFSVITGSGGVKKAGDSSFTSSRLIRSDTNGHSSAFFLVGSLTNTVMGSANIGGQSTTVDFTEFGKYGMVGTPTLSLGSLTTNSPFFVRATSPSTTAQIHYTIDGTEPTEFSPFVTNGGYILVSRSSRLVAKAMIPGFYGSTNATAEYGVIMPLSILRTRGFGSFGSADTMIPRPFAIVTNVGSAWNYTTNASEGSKLTILQDGVYSLSFNFPSSSSGGTHIYSGFSLNASAASRTNSIDQLSPPMRIGFSGDHSSYSVGLSMPNFSTVLSLASNDVIRPHSNGITPGNQNEGDMVIMRIGQILDTDKDGMWDSWEIQYFGDLSQNGSADYDGDGLSNLQEFQNGTDPTDFYNGVTPLLTAYFGNFQTGLTNSVLPQGLKVLVTTNGIALTNAPLTYDVHTGGGTIATNTTFVSSIQLRSDASGFASVSLKLAESPTNSVRVSTLGGASAEVLFHARAVKNQSFGSMSMLRTRGFAAYGSTDTKILRSDFTITNVGSAWTYSTNATEGSKITIQEDGIYSLSLNMASPTNAGDTVFVGFSLNASSTDRTNSIQNLVPPYRLGISSDHTSSTIGSSSPNFSVVIPLISNDVVRPHSSGFVPGTQSLYDMCVTKIGAPPVRPFSAPTMAVRTLGGGDTHVLALSTNGDLYGWGRSGFGEIGVGTNLSFVAPTLLTTNANLIGFTNVVSVSHGNGNHTLVARSDGSVWGWGLNNFGQLGNNATATFQQTPVQAGISNVIALHSGAAFSMALKSDGTVWTWGRSAFGELGNGVAGPDVEVHVPRMVTNLSNVVQIAGGAHFALALCSNGLVYSWGNNDNGQLGTGDSTEIDLTIPTLIPNFTNIVNISARNSHSLAVRNDGQPFAWGLNGNYQLGINQTTIRTLPSMVSNLVNVAKVSAGDNSSYFLSFDGILYACGRGDAGQIGNGSTTNAQVPVVCFGMTNILDVTGSHKSAFARRGSQLEIYGWGIGTTNQGSMHGLGTTTNEHLPSQITFP